MATINLTVYRNKNATLRFNIDNLPASGLAGCTVVFTVKRDKTDSATFFAKTSANGASEVNIVTVGSDTVDGVVDVFLLPADTSALSLYTVAMYYDLVVTDASAKTYHAGDGLLTIDAGVKP